MCARSKRHALWAAHAQRCRTPLPQQLDHFKQLRAQTSVPLAMGVSLITLRKALQGVLPFPDADRVNVWGQELFVNVNEYLPLIRDRLIDFIRVQ